jgi:transcriptional regulator with XRE-family HTH domain
MTALQLQHIRQSRNLTRQGLAAFLGDCTGSAVNHWESGKTPIPGWVAAKLLGSATISIPLTELGALLEISRQENLNFDEFLSQALLEHIARHTPAAKPVSYLEIPFREPRVAEDPT